MRVLDVGGQTDPARRHRADHIRMILGCSRIVVPRQFRRALPPCGQIACIAAVQRSRERQLPSHGTCTERHRGQACRRGSNGWSRGARNAHGWLSVKPSAQPTLVRTQHLPPSNSQVRPGLWGRVSCVAGAVWDNRSPCGTSRFLALFGQVRILLGAGSGWRHSPRCCRAWLSSG
jgi:hypothetical protein